MTVHVLLYGWRVGRHLVVEMARRVAGRGYRIALVLLAVVAGLVMAVAAYPQASPWFNGLAADNKEDPPPARTGQNVKATGPTLPAAVETGLLPWQLRAPLSREVVLPRTGKRGLVVLGGLSSGGVSTNGIDLLDPRNGVLSPHGSLLQATHDAAGGTLGTRLLVIGGGTTAPAGTTQIETGTKVRPGSRARGPTRRRRRGDDRPHRLRGRRLRRIGTEPGGRRHHRRACLSQRRRAARPGSLSGARRGRLADLRLRRPLANGHPTGAVQLVDTPAARRASSAVCPSRSTGAAAGVMDGTIYLAGGQHRDGPGQARSTPSNRNGSSFLRAGTLRVPVAYAGAAVTEGRLWIVGGESKRPAPTTDVQMVVPNRAFGSAGDPGAGSPFFGTSCSSPTAATTGCSSSTTATRSSGEYPSHGRAAPHGGFYFPDDAFFIRHGRAIISNQEDNDTIVEIAYPSGRITFHYGHPRTSGICSGLPPHPRRRLPARQRPDDRRRPRELPRRRSSTRARSASSIRSALPDAACTTRRTRSARRTATRPSRTETS